MNQSPDERLRLLADRGRRQVIDVLRTEPQEGIRVAALADRLLERRTASDGGLPRTRERIVVDLHHVTLPKLEAHGVVDHDRTDGTVRYVSDGSVEALLDSFPAEFRTSARR